MFGKGRISNMKGLQAIGSSGQKQIFYISRNAADNWFDYLPGESWLLFVITDEPQNHLYHEIINRAIEKDVNWISSTGNAAEIFHDYCDQELLFREAEGEYQTAYTIVTTGDAQFEKNFWFSVQAAVGEKGEIKTIFCLDLTAVNHSEKIKTLLAQINSGWIPPDPV